MLTDTVTLLDGSIADNLAIKSGDTLPTGVVGEVFYKTGVDAGLYVHDGSDWAITGSGGGGGSGIAQGPTLPAGSYIGELFNKTGANANTYIYNGSVWTQLISVWAPPIDQGGEVDPTPDPDDGYLWAWGLNNYGQIGDSSTISKSVPTLIGTSANWKYVKGSQYYGLAITSDDKIYGWGYAWGQFGTPVSNKSSPVQIGSLTSWGVSSESQIVLVYGTIALIKNDGTLWLIGYNGWGQLGDGTQASKSSFIQLGTSNNWAQISGTTNSMVAIKTDGTMWSWGQNNSGELGLGDTVPRSSPVQVGSESNWFKIFGSEDQQGESFYAIKTNGTLWAWGNNQVGQLGNGLTGPKSTPIQIGALNDWKHCYVGNNFVFAEKQNGTFWSWGYGGDGALANGNGLSRSSPALFGGTWKKLKASTGSVIAIKTDGTLWAWGYNAHGQAGDGTTANKMYATQIGSANTWKTVGKSNQTTYAIKF